MHSIRTASQKWPVDLPWDLSCASLLNPARKKSDLNLPAQKLLIKCWWNRPLGSISPTFYEQLLRTQIPKVQLSCLTWLSFFALLRSESIKAANIMSVKLTHDHLPSSPPLIMMWYASEDLLFILRRCQWFNNRNPKVFFSTKSVQHRDRTKELLNWRQRANIFW